MTFTSFTDPTDATPANFNSVFTELDFAGSTVFNVKHPTYGAVGDKSTDDTAAIQAALDAADITGNGAGMVWIPEGVYTVTGLTIGSQVTLAGTGWGSHLFHKASSSRPLITTDKPSSTVGICIRDLLLDGNEDNQTDTLEGIFLDATGMSSTTLVRHRIYNVYLRNVSGTGLWTQHPGRQSFFANVNIRGSAEYNFRFDGTESHVTDCVSSSAGWQGFFCTGDTMSFVGCRSGESGAVLTTSGDGFLFQNATRISLTNCISSACQEHGFHFFGQSGAMEGPTLVNCHSINDNQAEGGSNGFQFNNVVRAQGRSLKVTTTDGPGVIYGVGFAGGADDCHIELSSQGHQTAISDYDAGNSVNGLGFVKTFGATDTTPSVVEGSKVFLTHASTQTLTDFDDGVRGQEITVISKAAVTFAFSGDLTGSSASLVTASGDITRWVCEDGTVWILLAYVDVSVDNSAGA